MKHTYNGKEVKVKATYRNSPLYAKILANESGCYFDKDNMELRVILNRSFNAEKEGITQT